MKTPVLLTVGGLAIALASCGSVKRFHQPLSGDTSFDPLSAPGSRSTRAAVVAPSSPSYKPGQWVETSMPNATFFRAVPKGNATADKTLPVSTPLKVISTSGTYVRVELDSGETGFVPEIMVAERSETVDTVPIIPPSLDAVPPVNAPAPDVPGLPPEVAPVVPPPSELPDIAPPPEVPGIVPPQIVD